MNSLIKTIHVVVINKFGKKRANIQQNIKLVEDDLKWGKDRREQ